MVIQNVTIKNFKGIEEKTIELKPGFNLIKGVNGKGKTSILEAISVGLGGHCRIVRCKYKTFFCG